MAKDKKTGEIKDVAVNDKPESSGVRVTNTSTTTLQIGDVKLKPGRSAFFPNFDTEDAKNKAFIRCGMFSVDKA